jgi:hypothetical protein
VAAHRDAGPGRGRQLIFRRYLAPRRRVSISMTMKPALHGLDHSSRIHNAETRVLVSRLRAHVATKKAPLRRGFLLRVDHQIGRPIRSLSVGVTRGKAPGRAKTPGRRLERVAACNGGFSARAVYGRAVDVIVQSRSDRRLPNRGERRLADWLAGLGVPQACRRRLTRDRVSLTLAALKGNVSLDFPTALGIARGYGAPPPPSIGARRVSGLRLLVSSLNPRAGSGNALIP